MSLQLGLKEWKTVTKKMTKCMVTSRHSIGKD